MNKGKLILIGGGFLVLGFFLIYPRLQNATPSNPYQGKLKCLLENLPQVQHWHPHLTIKIDGKEQIIPANIGLGPNCHLPLHTHMNDNIIHVESQIIRDYTLGEFFEVWGESLQKENYELEMTVNGQPNSEYGNLVLKDGQKIVLNYVTKL